MTQYIVRAARAHEWPEIGRVLGRAFATDPVWRWVVRDHDHIAARVGAALAAVARLHAGTCDVVDSGDATIGAVAQWAAPGHWRLPVTSYLRIAPTALRALGPSSIGKIGALGVMDKKHPREPHWYLGILGTDPDHQGRGLASALLEHRLSVCDRELVPAYLESSKESNISFYERHGFRVVEEVPLAKDGPHIWTMWRDPQHG